MYPFWEVKINAEKIVANLIAFGNCCKDTLFETRASSYIEVSPMSSKKIVIAFDLFGTLLSTTSIAKDLAEHFPDKADAIAATWRTYQLEYTWRLNSMGMFLPYYRVIELYTERPNRPIPALLRSNS